MTAEQDDLGLEVPAHEPELEERAMKARTSVRGIKPRDLDRELADWSCIDQESIPG